MKQKRKYLVKIEVVASSVEEAISKKNKGRVYECLEYQNIVEDKIIKVSFKI